MKIKTTEKEYAERFWTKIDKESSNIFYNGSRCWEWTGALLTKGYGQYRRNGRDISAHRYSYFLNFGEFDTKLNVLHHCDNRKCVNPSHLFLGTNLENVQDRNKKGRQFRPVGEANGHSKITEKDVIEIYKMYDSGKYKQKEIAQMFGIAECSITFILTGKSWNYLFKKNRENQ